LPGSTPAQRAGRTDDIDTPGVIDLHTHVLPGIDDGPETLDGSLAFARAAVAAGTRELVATPHIDWTHGVEPSAVAPGVHDLQRRLDEAEIPIRVRPGAEVAITRAAELDEDALRSLRLGGGEWLLAECPLSPSATGFEVLLHHLQARGHRIVLAHPERSPAVQRNPELLERLVSAGMLTSITAGSLTGAFGSKVRDTTYELVERGLVHNVASDAHSAERRTPRLRQLVVEADEQLPGLADRLDWLCHDVPRAVLDGGPVPEPPGPPPQRRRRGLARLRAGGRR